MKADAVSQYVYVKRSLCGVFAGINDVPEEFLMDWLKDTFDFQRSHSDEELQAGMTLEPEGVLQWLEETAQLTWDAKKALLSEAVSNIPKYLAT
ncbi:MAG: hypothetical protein KGL32_10150 [candidate division NC10 bacterium]|nr:hypothetical protein [candidate division NC10 bacterium]